VKHKSEPLLGCSHLGLYNPWMHFFYTKKRHDLEGYFESLAEQGFQNNLFSVLA